MTIQKVSDIVIAVKKNKNSVVETIVSTTLFFFWFLLLKILIKSRFSNFDNTFFAVLYKQLFSRQVKGEK